MTTSWLADKIEQWPTAKLVPYARNARTVDFHRILTQGFHLKLTRQLSA